MAWTLMPYGSHLLLHRLGHRLQRVLGGRVHAPVGRCEQAAHRGRENDLRPFLLRDPLPDKALRQGQGQKDVDLVVAPDEIERDLEDRSTLAHAGVVPEHIDVPRLRVRDVVGVAQIELFDAEVGQAQRLRLFPQRRDVGRDLHCGDDAVAVLGHANRRGFAEA
jgi:hypothetical protein